MRLRFFNIVEVVNTFFRDLAPYLAEHDFDVEIHISDVVYREGRQPLNNVLVHSDVHLRYVRVGAQYKTNNLHKLLVYLKYIVVTMWRTLWGANTDLNFFLTQPPLFALWGVVLQWFRHQKFVILIMDLYPDILVKHGVFSESNVLYVFLHALSRFSIRRSNGIIVIGRCMKDLLIAEGIEEDKITVIPNWVDERIIREIPHEENPFRHQLGLQGKFVVLYSGNMGVAHSFDEILQVALDLLYREDLRFVFIGGGYRCDAIRQFIDEHNLTNVKLLPFQSIEKLHLSLSLGDIHFVSLRDGFEGLMVPSKSYGAFCAARPILYLGSTKGEIAQEILDYGLGTVIAPGDVSGMKATIMRYLDNKSLAQKEGKLARSHLLKKLSRENAIEQYRQTLQEIIDQ